MVRCAGGRRALASIVVACCSLLWLCPKKSKIIPEDGSGVFITHAKVRRLEWHPGACDLVVVVVWNGTRNFPVSTKRARAPGALKVIKMGRESTIYMAGGRYSAVCESQDGNGTWLDATRHVLSNHALAYPDLSFTRQRHRPLGLGTRRVASGSVARCAAAPLKQKGVLCFLGCIFWCFLGCVFALCGYLLRA